MAFLGGGRLPMYIAGGVLGAAALALGIGYCNRQPEARPPGVEISDDWIHDGYSKDSGILDSRKTWFYVIKECPRNGAPCRIYEFQGSKEAVEMAAVKLKRGDSVTFNQGNLDSIREAR